MKKIVLIVKRALRAPIKLFNKLRGKTSQSPYEAYRPVGPCDLKENYIRCTKRPKVSDLQVPAESDTNVPARPVVQEVTAEPVDQEATAKPIVPVMQSVPRVSASYNVSVHQRVIFYNQLSHQPKELQRPVRHVSPAIRELVNKIEARKGGRQERPLKQVSEKIAAMVQLIEGRDRETAIALPEAEKLALDEFFSWAIVPMFHLDEFFAWAQVPMHHLDVFFAEAAICMLQVDEFFTETDDEEPLVTGDQVKTFPRSCSFDNLQILTRGSIFSQSCPELFMLA